MIVGGLGREWGLMGKPTFFSFFWGGHSFILTYLKIVPCPQAFFCNGKWFSPAGNLQFR